MTRATVATMKAEAKRFIAALDRAEWNPAYRDDGMSLNIPEHSKHGDKAKIKRASLMLQNVLEDFRAGRMP